MLEQQLEEQTALWLGNPGKGLYLDREANVLYLSRLFSWYGGDFEPPGLEEFACQYAADGVCEYLAANDVRTAFLDYNWNLNSQTAATLMEGGDSMGGGGRFTGSGADGGVVTGGSVTGGSGGDDTPGSMTGGSGDRTSQESPAGGSMTGGSEEMNRQDSLTGGSGGDSTQGDGGKGNGATVDDGMYSVADITKMTQPWNNVLSRHVQKGQIQGVPLTAVDYAGIDTTPEGELAAFLASLSALDMSKVPESEMLALLINAYNAFTVHLIASNIEDLGTTWNTIMQLSSEPWPASTWTTFTFSLGGTNVTLDELEHSRIRGEFAEPRIHAAVNCAAVSCPDLRAEAYTGAMLEQQLEEQTIIWLSNIEKGMRLDEEANV